MVFTISLKESSVKDLQRLMMVIIQIGILYGFFLFGKWVQETLGLLMPGSVIGLITLFILLLLRVIRLEWISLGAEFMVKHLVIFFVPAIVGVMNYFHIFAGKGIWLIVITIISTIAVMISAAVVSSLLTKRAYRHE